MALQVVQESPLEGDYAVLSPEKLAAVQQLNVDPANSRFMLLVDDLLRPESLPRGWTSEFNASANKWLYKDKAGHVHERHPVFDYYVGAMFMDQGGYAQLKAIAAARPASADEVQQMGQYFCIKADEDRYIWEVAEMGLCAPLPPGWKEEVVQDPGCPEPSIAFKNETTGEVQQEHPLDNYFRELIRRRRRELLRRKKAALKSLQALVKMGMGRRSMLSAAAASAAAAAAAGNSNASTEPHDVTNDELDDLNPETQASLATSWTHLLSTATHLVHCMQAVSWDPLTPSTSPAASDTPTGSIAAITSNPVGTAVVTDSLGQTSGGNTAAQCKANGHDEATNQQGTSIAPLHRATARQQQLQKLTVVLAAASASAAASVDATGAPVAAAAAAPGEVQQVVDNILSLTKGIQAAGDNHEALAALLTQQGIPLPDYVRLSAGDLYLSVESRLQELAAPTGSSACEDCNSSSNALWNGVCELRTGRQCSPMDDGLCDGQPAAEFAPDDGSTQRTTGSRRPSLEVSRINDGSAEREPVRRPSLLQDALPFVGYDGRTASTVGLMSVAGCEPWSMAGGLPDAVGEASAAAARGAVAARACGLDASGYAPAFLQAADSAATAPLQARDSAIASNFLEQFDAAVAGSAAADARVQQANVPPVRQADSATATTAHNGASSPDRNNHAAATATVDSQEAAAGQVAGGHVAVVPTPQLRADGQLSAPEMLSLEHASGYPSSSEAAETHLNALQGVFQQALHAIQAWQEQKALNVLLQQHGQQCAHAAKSVHQQMVLLARELYSVRAQQQQQRADMAANAQQCGVLQLQLSQARDDAGAAAHDKKLLQQQLLDVHAELAANTSLLEQALRDQSTACSAEAAAASSALHQQMQQDMAQLSAALQVAQVGLSSSQEECVQLKRHLAAVEAEKGELGNVLGQCKKEVAGLKVHHEAVLSQCKEEVAVLQAQHEAVLIQCQQEVAGLKAHHEAVLSHCKEEVAFLKAQHDAFLLSSSSAAATASAEVQTLKHLVEEQQHRNAGLQQELEAGHDTIAALQQQQEQLQQQIEGLQAARCAQETQQQQLEAAAGETQQLLKALQASHDKQNEELSLERKQHAALQAEYSTAIEQQQQLNTKQQALQTQLCETQAQLSDMQIELTKKQAQLSDTQAQLSDTQTQLSDMRAQLSDKQTQLSDTHAQLSETRSQLSDMQTQLAAMQASAAAAEHARLSMPHKSTQVAAADHCEALWVTSRAAQTGSDLVVKATRDAGTPADLSLLSHFFREIKQKQRGGGGAILGYDPQEAAQAAAGPVFESAKSWSGANALPPIAASLDGGGRHAKSAAPHKSAGINRRPDTFPGSLGAGKRGAEEQEETGGFDTRPPAWEVRQRVDRRRDRSIKLAAAKDAGDGDKWDYAQDERDNEIAELKRRLVEAEKKAKDATSKAADEVSVMMAELQTCKRTLENSQAENFTLSKDVISLRLAMQALQLADGAAAPGNLTTSSDQSSPGPLSSTMPRGSVQGVQMSGSLGSRASMSSTHTGNVTTGPGGTVPRSSTPGLLSGGAMAWSSLNPGTYTSASGHASSGGPRSSSVSPVSKRLSVLPLVPTQLTVGSPATLVAPMAPLSPYATSRPSTLTATLAP